MKGKTMDRMEILRLAMTSAKDAREALTLAKEMAAFVAAEPAPPPSPIAVSAPLPAAPARAPRYKRQWTDEEKRRAAALLDEGASYSEVARIMGRSRQAVLKQRVTETLPVKKHALNPERRLSGAVRAVSRGLTVSDRVKAALFDAVKAPGA